MVMSLPAARRVVLAVGEAAEDLRVPGGADHQVGQLGRAQGVGVAELLDAPVQKKHLKTILIKE